MDQVLLKSGAALASLIRDRIITSREVVETHIEQIRKVNPTINAVVCNRFDEAVSEAKKADELMHSVPPDKLPPFHGVPFTMKEILGLAGMPQTSGLVSRRGVVAQADGTAVARLRGAGAIPLGLTNISELCMWMETGNKIYGRTSNPYNPSRIVGGSSGGEGALICAAGAPFGLGSDIGGSIRMPAFFNGVFGHKATGGLIPNTGQYPSAENEAKRYLTTGPLCRKAEDLWPLIKILAGPDGVDDGCRPLNLGDPMDVDLSRFTVFVVPDNSSIRVSNDLKSAQNKAAQALTRLGAKAEFIEIPELKESRDIWSSMLGLAHQTTFSKLMGNGVPINGWVELIRWFLGISPHTLPGIGLVILEGIKRSEQNKLVEFARKGRQLRKKIEDLLGPNGMILYPPYPTTAPRHNRPLFPPFNWVYTAIWNVLEFPVTQVPLGLDEDGLPLGVQVIAPHGMDHVSVRVALELEKAFGGWVPPNTAQIFSATSPEGPPPPQHP